MLYYKIPPSFVVKFGLANTFTKFPDGNFFVPRAFLARIDADVDKALEICGGVALTLDEARDEQLGVSFHPLPGDAQEDAAGGSAPEEGAML